jgi:hypothetical protein
MHEYVLQYMQDVVSDLTAPPGIVSFAEGMIQQARSIPVHNLWPWEMPFTFDDGLQRWLPNLISLQAPTMQGGTGSMVVNPLDGHSQQPHSQVTPAKDITMSLTTATDANQLPIPAVSDPQSTTAADMEMDKLAEETIDTSMAT